MVKLQVISGLIGSLVGIPRYYGIVDSMWPVLTKGFLMGFAISGMVVWLDRIFFEARLKKVSLPRSILIKSATYLFVLALVWFPVTYAYRALLPMDIQQSMIGPVVAVTFLFILAGTSINGIARLLGTGVLISFLTGRYHKPSQEERIFMFMDLIGSTAIAERLGNVRYYEFLNDFFCDVSEVMIEHRGEIYKYVGDEAIVVWNMHPGRNNQDCLECYFAILDRIGGRAAFYEGRYGCLPQVRVGMHCGVVLVGEIGGHRREIVFLGDVVNTAARIQAECKQLGRDILISQALMQRIELYAPIRSQFMGEASLRGKEELVELFAIDRGEPVAGSSPPDESGTALAVAAASRVPR